MAVLITAVRMLLSIRQNQTARIVGVALGLMLVGQVIVLVQWHASFLVCLVINLLFLVASGLLLVGLRSLEPIAHLINEKRTAPQRSELRFRSVFESRAVGVAIVSDRGEILEANATFCDLLGYTPETIGQQSVVALTHPDDHAHEQVFIDQLRAGQRDSYTLEKRYLKTDGSPVWARVSVSLSALPEGPPQYIGIVEDIQAHKRAEQALQESQWRFRAIFDSAAVGVALVSPQGDILEVNPALCRMLGYTEHEICAMNVADFTHPDDLPHEQTLSQEVWAEQEDHDEIETRYICKDGRVIWVKVSSSPVRDDNDQPRFGLGVVIDITARKAAEAALAKSNERYRITAEMVSDFVYSAVVSEDNDLTIDWATTAFSRYTGMFPEPFTLNVDLPRLTHPDDLPQLHTQLANTLANQSSAVEVRVNAPDGNSYWMQNYHRPVWDGDAQRVIRIYGAAQDITERKKVEEALRVSQQRFQALLHSEGVGVLVVDAAGQILETNATFRRVMGSYTADELLGTDMISYVHPEDQPACRGQFAALTQGTSQVCQLAKRYIRKDRQIVWLEVSASPILDPHQDFTQAVVIAKDITENKIAEDLLRNQWAFMRRIIDASPNLIFVKTEVGRYLLANQAMADCYGLAIDEVLGKTDAEFNPYSEQAEAFLEQDRQVWMTGEPLSEELQLELPALTPSMRWHQTNKVLITAPDNTSPLLLGVVNDITALKEAQTQLERSEIIYKAVIGALPDLLFRVNRAGEYVDVYANNDDLLAVPIENLRGRSVQDTVPPAVSEPAMVCLEQAFETGEVQELEYELDVLAGSHFFEARFARISDDEALIIVRDITQRKYAEQDARQLIIEQERSRILTEFIRDTEHEFATPISVIRSGTYIVRHLDTPEAQAAQLAKMDGQLYHIEQLVRGMTLMSRLDQGAEFDLQPVLLNDLFRTMCAIYAAHAQQRSLMFEYTIDAELPAIMGDLHFLKMALEKVLDNALTYTPPPGTITLQAHHNTTGIEINVADTGIGIAPEHHNAVFERFFRVDMQRSLRGAGLGLAIARKIVEEHGGTISVASAVEQGSTFTLWLPVTSPIT